MVLDIMIVKISWTKLVKAAISISSHNKPPDFKYSFKSRILGKNTLL